MNTLDGLEPRYDAVIVGARCAGAATARLLARSGAKVLVVDRQPYGSNTPSTHALMRGAVIQLARWGLIPAIEGHGTPRIAATAFHYGSETITVPIKPEHGVDCLFAPRRTVLDRVLVDAARAAGAEIRHGVVLSDLLSGPGGRVTGVSLRDASGSRATIRAGIVIGADGRQSAVAERVAARPYAETSHASGIVFGYFENLGYPASHWYFGDACAAGVIPTNGGHCVFTAVPARRFAETHRGDVAGGFFRILDANSRELRADVERGTLAGRLSGFGGGRGYLRQCQGPGWALVGDAGYFRDPLTAHGITDAFRDAELLSHAVAKGGSAALVAYQRERDALSRPILAITDAIASFSWTVDTVQDLHSELSALMKVESSAIARFSPLSLLAA